MPEAAARAADGAPAAPRWERLEPDARRAQILQCARRLFTHRPYAAVSMEEVAKAAGVRRGLVNHYFGTKRALFLEVVKDLLSAFDRAFPASELPSGTGVADVEAVVGEHVDRWLSVVEGDVDGWFAFVSAEGFGRDRDVEDLVHRSRAATVERIVDLLRASGALGAGAEADPGADDGKVLRVVLRTYAGLAELATREWLRHRTIDRRQVHTLLTTALLSLVRDVVPAVSPGRTRAAGRSTAARP